MKSILNNTEKPHITFHNIYNDSNKKNKGAHVLRKKVTW